MFGLAATRRSLNMSHRRPHNGTKQAVDPSASASGASRARHAFLGIGFREREDAFALKACVQDFVAYHEVRRVVWDCPKEMLRRGCVWVYIVWVWFDER